MSKSKNDQILTKFDIDILNLILDNKKPTSKRVIYSYFKDKYNKFPQRINDRITSLINYNLLKECQGERKGQNRIMINDKDFVNLLIKKFKG